MAGTGFQFSPGAFRTKDADPEGTLELFERYCESMTRAFRLNRRTDPTTGTSVGIKLLPYIFINNLAKNIKMT